MSSGKEKPPMWTEEDDAEAEHGEWTYTAEHTFAEEQKIRPSAEPEEIWPDWTQGIPSTFRFRYWNDRFYKDGVSYLPHYGIEYLALTWRDAHPLSVLRSNYQLLPSTYTHHWTGVYVIFCPGKAIDRLCGKDPTGTLYVGQAGSGKKNWSILRNRIMSAAKGDHHAIFQLPDVAKRIYPIDTLWVQWAYTKPAINGKGESIGARSAESILLNCYRSSFGELPPLNEKR